MSRIEFVSHDSFPEDEYTKELVYICIDGKYRVAYVRKKSQTGGLFWSVASLGLSRNGKKEYYPAFIQDSNFLDRDIKDFLEKRKWEPSGSQNPLVAPERKNELQKPENEPELPF